MPAYWKQGLVPRKRHTALPRQPGFRDEGIHYEEVVTRAGFSGGYSILYHLRPPTRVARVEPAGKIEIRYVDQPALRHHHLKTAAMDRQGDPISGRIPLVGNADVALSLCRPSRLESDLFRNAGADELVFVHQGRGVLETMYGTLGFTDLDYLMIPRSTTYRLEFEPGREPILLVIESAGRLGIPPRYLNQEGQLKLGAPFGERDLRVPELVPAIDREDETAVLVKDGARLTRYTLAHHPFDVAGWDGMVYPYALNALDFEPITGTVHQPPPVHQTFDAEGFVVCTFAPRMLDTHPEAIKVPYAHSNIQADELLYYVLGRFGSRRGVESGSITLHPRGLPHGPHPGTIVASRDLPRTDELAVMMDTERPLGFAAAALTLDDRSYPYSWME